MSSPHSETSARALAALLGAFLAFFCSVGFLNAFGVFQEYYHANQLADRSEFDISWIGSFAVGFMFATAPVAGVLVDKLGAPILLLCGSIGTLVAVFMTSLSHEYYQIFLAQGVLLGGSMSFLFCPAVATISKYFHKNRGLALGITVGGSSTGGLVWPIVLDRLLNYHRIGFPWTLRIVGFIMLPLLLIALLSVQPPQSKSEPEPETEHPPSEKHKTDISIAKNPTFIILCSGLAICYLGMFSPFFYVTSYSSALGISTSLSFYMVSIVNAASLFGRVLPGLLADRYGHFNLCALAALTSGITCLCWTAATSTAGVVIWSLAYGFTSGAIMSLQSACAAQIATHETHGTAVGFLMGSLALTALFGTPISGELVGSYGYLALSLYSGASLVVGSLLIIWARLRLNRSLFAPM
ncbi:MFS monocarboxylate transporter [Macrophomina phaseolina]|uniref:MFS monocarboxylate transporter n=1 Tax=Macrophomina phaseolina TaxID=35725 RepID=A0ABQ8G5M7_9PEZI|nr:MFS monocarboxylate transporter [Macrophomina phaseolina]